MVKKKGGKIACGECKKYFEEDKLIADPKNNRYLCDSCYEPRDNWEPDQDPEIEREKCPHCGEYENDCECDKEDKEKEIDDDNEDNREYESPRTIRGEARIKRDSRTVRATQPKRENRKSLIW